MWCSAGSRFCAGISSWHKPALYRDNYCSMDFMCYQCVNGHGFCLVRNTVQDIAPVDGKNHLQYVFVYVMEWFLLSMLVLVLVLVLV